MYGDETVVGRTIPTPPQIAKRVEGLSTSGPMGTVPTITVGMLVTIATVALTIVSQVTGFTLPTEIQSFFDQYGMSIAAIAASLITSAITYFKVFAPKSVAEIQAGVR